MKTFTITGRVGNVDRVTETIVNVSIATDRTWKGQKETSWNKVSVYGQTASFVHQYCEKGDIVTTSGEEYQKSWTKDGETKKFAQLDGKMFKIIQKRRDEDSKSSSSGGSQGQGSWGQSNNQGGGWGSNQGGNQGGGWGGNQGNGQNRNQGGGQDPIPF